MAPRVSLCRPPAGPVSLPCPVGHPSIHPDSHRIAPPPPPSFCSKPLAVLLALQMCRHAATSRRPFEGTCLPACLDGWMDACVRVGVSGCGVVDGSGRRQAQRKRRDQNLFLFLTSSLSRRMNDWRGHPRGAPTQTTHTVHHSTHAHTHTSPVQGQPPAS